jgi:multiple sugar transport system permease protein
MADRHVLRLAYIVLIMVLAITNIYVKYLNKVKER